MHQLTSENENDAANKSQALCKKTKEKKEKKESHMVHAVKVPPTWVFMYLHAREQHT